MKRYLTILALCSTAMAQPFRFNDTAFMGSVHARKEPKWLSYVAVTGSPVSSWAAVYGSFALRQATGGSQPSVTASVFTTTQGITFDGTDDVLTHSGKAINQTQAGSLAVVFKTGASVTGPFVMLSQSDTAVANDWWEIGIAADGKIYIESNAAGTKHTVKGSTVLAVSTVYDLILTFDGTDYFLLLNNAEENPLVIESIGAFAWLGRVTGTTAFSFGATVTSGGPARFFNGSLGAVYFWAGDITQ